MFKLVCHFPTGPQGFVMQFANGLEASVMFGSGNYCSNRDKFCTGKSATAELVVFKVGTNEPVDLSGLGELVPGLSMDNVTLGWVSPDMLAPVLAAVAAMPKPK